MSTKPPRIVTAALVLPVGMLETELPGVRTDPRQGDQGSRTPRRRPRPGPRAGTGPQGPSSRRSTIPGFDILSTDASGDTFRIEVKARIDGAPDFFVTHNEVMTGKNAVPRYRLALVRVDPRGAQYDEVRYLDDPFATTDLGDFDATGIRGDWAKMWTKGSVPF